MALLSCNSLSPLRATRTSLLREPMFPPSRAFHLFHPLRSPIYWVPTSLVRLEPMASRISKGDFDSVWTSLHTRLSALLRFEMKPDHTELLHFDLPFGASNNLQGNLGTLSNPSRARRRNASTGALAFLSRFFMWIFHFRTASSAGAGDVYQH